ncbi:MAG: Rnase Y domain-containing protein, partial [Smithella sp.]
MFYASLSVLVIVVAVVSGIIIGFILKQVLAAREIKSSRNLMARIAEEAKKEAETIKKEAILQAKENLLKMKADFDSEAKERRNDFDARDKRIRSKEENLDKRIDTLAQKESSIDVREKSITGKEASIEEKRRKLDALLHEQQEKLEKIAGISPEEAKKILIQSMEADAKQDAAALVRKIEDEAKLTADRKSQEIVAYAIQRYAGDVVAEKTVSAVNLPSEEMKGRIIG